MTDANHYLYFVSRIEAGYAEDDRRQALMRAFTAIQSLGRRPEYEPGYRQFLRWMESVATNAPSGLPRLESDVIAVDSGNVRFDVYVDDRLVAIARLPVAGGSVPLKNASAGHYRVVSEGGRVLLDVTVRDEDLAESASALRTLPRAAAADMATRDRPSRSFFCLGPRLRLDAFRGMEVGALRLTLTPPRDPS